MRPYLDAKTGNFQVLSLILCNEHKEVLVQMHQGGYILPSFVVEQQDVHGLQWKEDALISRAKKEMEITLLERHHVKSELYEEEMKRFDCHYFLCRNWKGEIQKTKGEKRFLWAQRGFAQQLLSIPLDKDMLALSGAVK